MSALLTVPSMTTRFRGYLPVVVDVETGGFNCKTDALLEVAAVLLKMDSTGKISPARTLHAHIEPFLGAKLNPEALAFNGINPYHPFRCAQTEHEALGTIFKAVRQAIKEAGCTRAILVGHNPTFDLGFVNAAAERADVKRNPFHPFSSFDTATLGALSYGQTVLARAAKAAGIVWDNEAAHSAVYDAERTAEFFCIVVNRWLEMDPGITLLCNKAHRPAPAAQQMQDED